jgi:hypothetical protein
MWFSNEGITSNGTNMCDNVEITGFVNIPFVGSERNTFLSIIDILSYPTLQKLMRDNATL